MGRKEQERELLERIAALKNTLEKEKEKQKRKDEGTEDLAFTIHQCTDTTKTNKEKYQYSESEEEEEETTISDSLSFTRRTMNNGNRDTNRFLGESLEMTLERPKREMNPRLTKYDTETQLKYLSESLRETTNFEDSTKLLQTLRQMRQKHVRESFEEAQNTYLTLNQKKQPKRQNYMMRAAMETQKKDRINEIMNPAKRRIEDIINVIPPGIEGNPDRFPKEKSIFKKRKKEKKKFKVTIPEPFAFDEREATRAPTISERRFQKYIQDKKAEEENLVHYQFKAKPIPSSTLEPRYKELCEMREARSEEIKAQSKKWLMKNQRPFSFQERGDVERKEKKLQEKRRKQEEEAIGSPFKANPVPGFCNENNMYKFEVEDAVRQKRIKERAQKLLEEAKLPRRMQQHADAEHKTPKKKKKKTKGMFTPKVNTSVPDFVRLQNEFQRELAERKENKPRVEAEPFRFISKDASASHDKILADIAADNKNLPETRWPYMGTREKVPPTIPSFGEPDSRPRSTNANDLRSKIAREKLAKMEAEAQAKKEEAERRLYTNNQNNEKVSAHFGKSEAAKKRDKNLMNANIPNPKRKKRSTLKKKKLQPRPHQRKQHSKRQQYRAYQFESDFAEQVKRKVLSHVSDTLRDTGNEDLIAKVIASVN